MRVFDVYTFNIAKIVRFKDTKKYVDWMLKELQLSYQNIYFTINPFMSNIESIVEKYPNLSKYIFEYEPYRSQVLTSITPQWKKGKYYAEKEDWNSLFEIVSKCPRGFNVTGNVVFNQIDWFHAGIKDAALYDELEYKNRESAGIVSTHHIINSQIIIGREYDDGNKKNYVSVVIESTNECGEPRDTTAIVKRLKKYLGIPVSKEIVCREDLEKSWELQEKIRQCNNILKGKIDTVSLDERTKIKFGETEFVPKLVDKMKIKTAFRNTTFLLEKRKKLLPGMNVVSSIDRHNHVYEILFDRTQNCPDYFYWYIYIRGHNFLLSTTQNILCAANEEEAKEKLNEVAVFCEKLKGEMETILMDDFGETPEWYQ
ncbi:MAG: hypothetical protein K6G85_06305 [Eubacterium sp.]|nr:hypothetical protein [Eubacterium sp.]